MEIDELRSFLEKILRRHEQDKELIVSKVEKEKCCEPGDGFMSDTFGVKIFGKRGSGIAYANRIFIKRLPLNSSKDDTFQAKHAFNNEAIVYNELLPLIPDCNKYIATCLYAGEDCIVLENLRTQGFLLADKKSGMNEGQSELALKTLGNFHASSYHMEMANNATYSKIITKFYDFFTNNANMNIAYESGLARSIESLKRLNDKTLETGIKKLEALQGKVFNTLHKLAPSNDLTVLGHGDYWTNNLMFRYQDSIVTDIRVLDFQGVSPMSPAVDLWKFLYLSLSYDFLNHRGDDLISLYCSSFIDTLRKLKTPNEKIPNLNLLRNEIFSRELCGLLLSVLHLPIVYLDMSQGTFDTNRFMSEHEYRENHLGSLDMGYSLRIAELVKRCEHRNII